MLIDLLPLDEAISILNRFVAADPEAMRQLLETRVICNEALAADPTCQIAGWDGQTRVGLLGVLNGLFGTYPSGDHQGWGPITAVFSDDEKILYGFRRAVIEGFTIPKESEIPPEVKLQFRTFMGSKPADSFTICENDAGWYLFTLGLENQEEPLLTISK